MTWRAAALIFRRATERNEIARPFLVGNFVSTVVLASIWLAPIDNQHISNPFFAATAGALAQTPVLATFKYVAVLAKARIIKFVALVATLVAGAFVFYAVFSALLLPQYLGGFRGIVSSSLTHAVGVLNCFLIYAFITESIYEYRVVRSAHQKANAELQAFQVDGARRLSLVQQKILAQVKDALVPPVTAIRANLAARNYQGEARGRLDELLRDVIRPLSVNLRGPFDGFLLESVDGNKQLPLWGSVPKSFSARETFNPTFATWLLMPMFFLTTSSFTSLRFNLELAAEIAGVWLILLASRRLLPKSPKHWAAALLSQQALVWAVIASVSIVWSSYVTTGSYALKFVGQVGILIGATTLLFTFASINEWARVDAASSVATMLSGLHKSQALFSQQLWILKRNWSYLIHGKVQSHILAARILSQSSDDGVLDRQQLEEHLDAVIDVLTRPPEPDADLDAELLDLQATWKGVATLKFTFANGSRNLLHQDAKLRFAVNEILREAVSNAIKHGCAKRIEGRFAKQGASLVLTVTNDGKASKASGAPSLGTEMLDELTESWRLKVNKKAGLVTLIAKLPTESAPAA